MWIAAINSPDAITVAGSVEAINALEARIVEQAPKLFNRRLKVTHATGTTYPTIVSCSYGAVTTVMLDAAISNPISKVYHSTVSSGVYGQQAHIVNTDTNTTNLQNTVNAILVAMEEFGILKKS